MQRLQDTEESDVQVENRLFSSLFILSNLIISMASEVNKYKHAA